MISTLILAEKNDVAARKIAQILMKKNVCVLQWPISELALPMTSYIYLHPTKNSRFGLQTPYDYNLAEIDVVWYRSATPKQDKPSFIQQENHRYQQNMWQILAQSAIWINPLAARIPIHSTAVQLLAATEMGLTIPETLLTNDKDLIMDFLQKNKQGSILYKTFSVPYWKQNGITLNVNTLNITSEMLPAKTVLQATPGIYQKQVKKSFEVRVIFMGEHYVAIKIHNREAITWKMLYPNNGLKLCPLQLPRLIERQCILLMKKLGLVWGCFDFIVTPQDEYVFLEVNDHDNFLWIDESLPQVRLMELFCDFLIAQARSGVVLH